MAEIQRDPLSLTNQVFDVLIIGGGINGAAIAWDCALRGFKTLLIEKSDFGAGASSGCFKIAHGGLRYLQHLDIRRLKESVSEQRIIRLIAPHFIHPLPFLIPCYGLGMKSRAALKAALVTYEYLADGRNDGVSDYHHLPGHRFISKEECLKIAPGISERGLSGGVVYYDCQMSNCERLTFAVVQSAVSAGAKVCNYLEAVKLVVSVGSDAKECIDLVEVKDNLDGRIFRLRAKMVVNAAGPWCHKVISRVSSGDNSNFDAKGSAPFFSKGIQLVGKKIVSGYAFAFESRYRDDAAIFSRGGRSFFVHPWRGCSLLGTSDTLFKSDPDEFKINLDEIRSFLKDLKSGYDSNDLTPINTYFAFGGLRPIDISESEYRELEKKTEGAVGDSKVSLKDRIYDHCSSALPESLDYQLSNLITVIGMKYTTFRAIAQKVSDIVSEKLRGKVVDCGTSKTVLRGGAIDDYNRQLSSNIDRFPQLSQSTHRHLLANYGSEAEEIYQIFSESAEYGLPLSQNTEVLKAEIINAARYEIAPRLVDVVLRRTGLGSLGFPGEEALNTTLELMGAELGWDKAKRESELDECLKVFSFG